MLYPLILFLKGNFEQVTKNFTLFSKRVKDEEFFDKLGRCEDVQEKDAEGGVG
jgi:hypothetical protein